MRLLPWRHRNPPQTAAAQQLSPEHGRFLRRTRQPWQQRAAWFARHMGAIRFAMGIKADAGARCEIRPEKLVDPRNNTWEPIGPGDDQRLTDVTYAYRGQYETTQELIRQHIWNYETVGECLQIIDRAPDGTVRFSIRSMLHAEWQSAGVLIRDVPGGTIRDGTARLIPWELARRLWVPDEEWPGLATSPLQGVMADCERYHALARRIRREAESALQANGLLWTPAEGHKELPREQQGPGGGGVPRTNIEKAYYETAQTALEDDDAPEAVARLLLRWAKEYGPPIPVDLAAQMSDVAIDLRNEALEAIGRGLDYPQRLFVSGAGEGNHWSDWLLKEEFASEAISPMLEKVLWRDVTESYFRPALRQLVARGVLDVNPDEYRVGFDISPIVVHPDMTANAIELYRLGVLSDTKLLQTTGFDPASAPDRAELGRWIMRTQIMRETIRGQDPNATPGGDVSRIEQTVPAPNQLDPAAPPALNAALEVASRVRTGPMAAEAVGWLD